jgi:hypothetical protein
MKFGLSSFWLYKLACCATWVRQRVLINKGTHAPVKEKNELNATV